MLKMRWTAAVGALLVLASAAAAKAPSLDDLLRQPAVNWMALSPKGDYYAISVPMPDRVMVAVLRRSDLQVTARIDPGKDGRVDSIVWVEDERLFASWSFKSGQTAQPVSANMIYAINADGSGRRGFYGALVDPLVDKPGRVLVQSCVRMQRRQCLMRLQEVPAQGGGKTIDIVDGPVPDAMFMTDRIGAPRFAWAIDDDDVQTVYVRRDDAWVLVNDEAKSGLRVSPVGMDYALQAAYLWAERTDGPDVIERMDLATGSRRVVASHPRLSPHSIVRSLDGREPIGVRYGTGVPTVTFFDDTHPHAVLIRALEAEFPGQFARVVSSSRDGRSVVALVSSDREPGRFYSLESESGEMRAIMRSHSWLEPDALSATTPVEFAARDGLSLDGYLTRPAHVEGDAPLVVLVHGGPFGVQDAWGYDKEVQILAAQGYAVMQVNFRGSSGRGRGFERLGYREWGGAMQRDVTDATRWAQAQAGIDPARACIMGGSYGAYAALMGAAREPELYRCAIGFAGPYDLPTMFRWGDTQRSRWGRNRLADIIGTEPAELREASVTTHAARIRADLLLVQGARDPRVSPEHFRAMRGALDAAGVPYQSHMPLSETHGLYDRDNERVYYGLVLETLSRNLATNTAEAAATR